MPDNVWTENPDEAAEREGGGGDTPVTPASMPAEDMDKMTKAQLEDQANAMGLDIPAGATKSDLIELLRNTG